MLHQRTTVQSGYITQCDKHWRWGMLKLLQGYLWWALHFVYVLCKVKLKSGIQLTVYINVFTCPVNGGWNSWGSWTSCTATCGGGTKSRSRSCTNPSPANGGKPCPGSSGDRPACNTNGCPGMPHYFQTSLFCYSTTEQRVCKILLRFYFKVNNAMFKLW